MEEGIRNKTARVVAGVGRAVVATAVHGRRSYIVCAAVTASGTDKRPAVARCVYLNRRQRQRWHTKAQINGCIWNGGNQLSVRLRPS